MTRPEPPVAVSSSTISVLSKNGLHCDYELCLLVCWKCQYALNPNARCIRTHIKDRHATDTVPTLASIREAIDSHDPPLINDEDPSLSDMLEPGDELRSPIPGIKVQSGYRCSICPFCCVEKGTMQQHLRTSHQGSHCNERTCSPSLVQSPFQGTFIHFVLLHNIHCHIGTKRCYFGVHHLQRSTALAPLNESDVSSAVEDLLKDSGNRVAPLDERCRHPLIQSTHWDRNIDSDFGSFAPADLMELCAEANEDCEFDLAVLDATNEFIDRVHLYLEQIPFATSRKILGGNTQNQVETRGFHGYQELSTRKRCAARLARMLLMLCRIMDDLERFGPILVDDEELVSAVHRLRREAEKLEPSDLVGHVQTIIKCLFARTCGWRESYLSFMIYRFIMFSNMLADDDSSYTFRSPLKISSGLSEVQFWARSMIVMDLYRDRWAPGEQAPGTYEFENLCEIVTDGRNSPFNSVRELLRLLSTIIGSQPEMPAFYWTDDACRTLASGQNAFSISLEHLAHMVDQLTRDACDVMTTKLLYGFDLSEFDQLISGPLFDNLHDNKPGYSFINNPKNNFRFVSDKFIRYMMSTCRDYFIDRIDSGHIVWNSGSVHKYLKACDEFHEHFLTIVHLTSGQPLRAEEAKSLMLSRTSTSIHRSIYWINGRICMVQRYHKGTSKAGRAKYVARFIAPEHTRLCLVYLCLIRPLQQ